MALLSPALAWLRDRRWRWLLRAPLPKLGLIQPAPRVITEPIVRSLVPGGGDGWSAAGVDEFLRCYLTPRGRVAFYESARNIYLDEPHGERGSGPASRRCRRRPCSSGDATTSWSRSAFESTSSGLCPAARHLELDCGHVPQLEAPRGDPPRRSASSSPNARSTADGPARQPSPRTGRDQPHGPLHGPRLGAERALAPGARHRGGAGDVRCAGARRWRPAGRWAGRRSRACCSPATASSTTC